MKSIIRAEAGPWRQDVRLYIASPDKKTRVKQIVFEKVEEAMAMMPDSSFELSHEAAQTLMDDLWQAGMRPTEGTGSAGAMRAVERHLEDMRTLVFKTKTK